MAIDLGIPDITIVIRTDPDYNINMQPSSLVVQRTGSLPLLAVSAYSASYAVKAQSLLTSGTVESTNLSASNDAYIGNKLRVANVESNQFKLIAGPVSITLTGSITTGIFGATEFVLPSILTSSFCATTVEYVASRVGSTRVGFIMAAWSGSKIAVSDVSNTDIGDTSDIQFSVVETGGYIKLRVSSLGSGSYPWTVQTFFKLFPVLV